MHGVRRVSPCGAVGYEVVPSGSWTCRIWLSVGRSVGEQTKIEKKESRSPRIFFSVRAEKASAATALHHRTVASQNANPSVRPPAESGFSRTFEPDQIHQYCFFFRISSHFDGVTESLKSGHCLSATIKHFTLLAYAHACAYIRSVVLAAAKSG